MEKSRLKSFDLLKSFAIYLVIWGHCIKGFLSSDCSDNIIYRILYSFHVALFMMISGYFAVSSMRLKSIDFFLKKLRQLIYPCFIWGLIILLFVYLTKKREYFMSDISIKQLFIDLYWYADFWFLKSCFICYSLLFLGVHLGLKKRYWVILTLLISQLITPFFVSFMYPCFVIGYELKNNSSFCKVIRRSAIPLWCFFLIMLAFWNKTVWDYSHGLSMDVFNHGILYVICISMFRFYRLLIGVVGALACISLALNISNERINNPIVSIMCLWGTYTLEVYIMQSVILEKTIRHFINFDHLNDALFNLVVSPSLSLIILIVCVLLALLIMKSTILRLFLFGRK